MVGVRIVQARTGSVRRGRNEYDLYHYSATLLIWTRLVHLESPESRRESDPLHLRCNTNL